MSVYRNITKLQALSESHKCCPNCHCDCLTQTYQHKNYYHSNHHVRKMDQTNTEKQSGHCSSYLMSHFYLMFLISHLQIHMFLILNYCMLFLNCLNHLDILLHILYLMFYIHLNLFLYLHMTFRKNLYQNVHLIHMLLYIPIHSGFRSSFQTHFSTNFYKLFQLCWSS